MAQQRGRLRGRKEGLKRGASRPPDAPPDGSHEERLQRLREQALAYLEKEMDVLVGAQGNRKQVLEVLRGLGTLRPGKPGDREEDEDDGARSRWNLAESLGGGPAEVQAEGDAP